MLCEKGRPTITVMGKVIDCHDGAVALLQWELLASLASNGLPASAGVDAGRSSAGHKRRLLAQVRMMSAVAYLTGRRGAELKHR
jgi:hypothetical protein